MQHTPNPLVDKHHAYPPEAPIAYATGGFVPAGPVVDEHKAFTPESTRGRLTVMLLALFACLGLVTLTATPAQADVCPSCSGGRVYVSTLSDIRMAVTSTYTDPPPSSTIQYLYQGEWSHLATPIQDVDQFWVGPQCYAKNIDTGYKYYGGSQGLWHNMSSDSVRIRLNHQCMSPWT